MKNIVLAFPPFSESALHGPHLAIPILRGVLTEMGIASVSMDLNIKCVNEVLKKENLSRFLSLIDSMDIDHENKLRAISSIEQLKNIGVSQFLNSGGAPLKQILKLIRNVLFPTPEDIESCLKGQIVRPEMAIEIYDHFVDEIMVCKPDVIGFSVAFSEQLAETVELAKAFKKKSNGLQIWVGGSQINLLESSQIESLVNCGIFDRISLGNGEQTLGDLVDSYNIVASENGHKVVKSGSMHKEHINALPKPIFDENLNDYVPPVSLPVLVTKGCYWGKCTFCDYPKLSELGGARYISRDAKNVLNEIVGLKRKYRPAQINLISDAIPPKWYMEIARMAIDAGVKLDTWSYMMHHKNLDDDFFITLSEAGVKCINFGTESMIDRVLKIMKKQASSEHITKNIISARRAGITVVCNVIPDYPTTTREEAFQNVNLFAELCNYIDSLNPQMFDLTAGTPITESPNLFGVKVQQNAYQKTNHGYHSLVHEREDGLSQTDRSILKNVFSRMKWKTMVGRRLKYIKKANKQHDILVFDGSAVILPNDDLWLMSIGSQWKLSCTEKEIIDSVTSDYGGSISLRDFKKLSEKHRMKDDYFYKWLDSLYETGLIIDVEIHKSIIAA